MWGTWQGHDDPRASGVAMGSCHQRGPAISLGGVGVNVSAVANTFDVSLQALLCHHQCEGEVRP